MISGMQFTHLNQPLDLICSEQDAIESAKAGDLDAFNCLVQKHQDGLFRIACGIFGDEDLASDAVQDTFISAFRHIHSFRNGSFKSWLIRILVNKCGDELRSAHHRRMLSFSAFASRVEDDHSDAIFDVKDPSLPIEHVLETSELEQMIRLCLDELPVNYRSIVVLSDIEQLDYKEIADVLHIPVGTVKSRLARARAKLRGILLQHGALLPEKYVCE